MITLFAKANMVYVAMQINILMVVKQYNNILVKFCKIF